MKIIHTADVHLGSPLRGLESHWNEAADVSADEIRRAPQRAFVNLVEFALAERVDAVLIAGDLFDGAWRDFHTGLFFARQCDRLAEGDIRCVLVHGNHDAESPITNKLKLPDNVHVLSSRHPETWKDERLGLAVHGQSFARAAITENLALAYPKPLAGFCNMGLLHTAVDGASAEHRPYAPCSSGQLAAHGYSYWALGHVHARMVLHDDPPIVFSGNLQGRHARECGEKGFTLVEIEQSTGRTSHQSIVGDVVRWAHLKIDLGEIASLEDAFELAHQRSRVERELAGNRPIAMRIEFVGATTLHATLTRTDPAEIRANLVRATDEAGGGFWLERVVLGCTPAREAKRLLSGHSELAQMIEAVGHEADAISRDPAHFEGLEKLLADLLDLLPSECDGDDPLLQALRSKDLKSILDCARQRAEAELLSLSDRAA